MSRFGAARRRAERAAAPQQLRAAAIASRGVIARRLGERDELPLPAIRFVARCLQSWVAAGASPTRFLASWIPVRVAPGPSAPARRQPHRRPAAGGLTRLAKRAGNHPQASGIPALWQLPTGRGSTALVRTHYPYVAALLLELGLLRR